MQEDVRPEVEDLSRLVLWLTEVHRLDRIEVQKLQGEIGQAGQSTKKRSRFNRLSHGLTFREQWEEAEQKNREQGMDQVSREAMEEAEHARDQFYRDRVGIPGSTVRVDTYGRRVIIVPGDENDTDG
jgi:protein subunit release factor A